MSALDVRSFALGPIQTNSYVVRVDAGASSAVVIDPGEEAERLLAAAETLGVTIAAILITHCHFDHIGAVAPLAAATGAPVYCPERERVMLTEIMRFVPPGFGSYEGYEPEHTVAGGERLDIAGLAIDVLATPGHSPGHVTYAISAGEQVALFSGDVLFQGSVGRVDVPGGDWSVLERSIGTLLERYPPDTPVYPGHMGATTLGRERDTNPFLQELRANLAGAPPPASGAG
jgi:hydroxyacylglutathione hydrolase